MTIYRTVATNENGLAEMNFRIPLPGENPESVVLGTWNAVTTVDLSGERFIDIMSFDVERVLATDKSIYKLGENVTITLTNVGNETLNIGGYPAWQIFTYPNEEPVYPMIFSFLQWSLEPGENDTFVWNQYNEFNGNFCESGEYVVKDTQGWNLSAYFTIVALTNPVRSSDVDGNGRVDMGDIIWVCDSFGSRLGQQNYRLNFDLNDDGKIDLGDIIIVCEHFGQTYS